MTLNLPPFPPSSEMRLQPRPRRLPLAIFLPPRRGSVGCAPCKSLSAVSFLPPRRGFFGYTPAGSHYLLPSPPGGVPAPPPVLFPQFSLSPPWERVRVRGAHEERRRPLFVPQHRRSTSGIIWIINGLYQLPGGTRRHTNGTSRRACASIRPPVPFGIFSFRPNSQRRQDP